MEMQPNSVDPLFPAPLPLTHRRSISDLDLRLLNDICDPFDLPSQTFDKIAAAQGDHLFDSFLNLDFIASAFAGGDFCGLNPRNGDDEVGDCFDGIPDEQETKEVIQPKKAMSPDKLAELWIFDPKRAKRIMANRHSAARSKERKARYVVELEKKVQSLQRQATTLSVQYSLFERDTSSLNVENAELRRELEFMEQQARLRDALNEALESELERLKVATGEKTKSDAYLMTTTFSSNFPIPIETTNMSNSFSPYELLKPNMTKYEPDLYTYNQTNTSLKTDFLTSFQPMLVPIIHQGIDVGAKESWYDHGR